MEHPEGEESEDLIIRLLDGEAAAFTELLDRYKGVVWSALQRFHGKHLAHHDLEEVFCETFERAWKSIGTFDDRKAKLATWLFRIAENAARSRIRVEKRRREETRDEEYWKEANVPELTESGPANSDDSTSEPVRQALAKLSEAERTILEADAHAHPGVADASMLGEMLGLPAGTVRVYRNRAHEKMRIHLKKDGTTAGRFKT